VVSGRASDALLDSYEAERVPVAERLLNTTDRAFSLIVSNSRLAGLMRTAVLARLAAFAMRFDRVRKLAFLTISQTGIQYREGPLSQALSALAAEAPQPGDRFPWMRLKWLTHGAESLFQHLDDTCFHLLVFGQPSTAFEAGQFGELLHVHRISEDVANNTELARLRVPKPSFYLIRPDGYIGLAGTKLDATAVSRYLAERVHLRSAAPSGLPA